MFDSIRKKIFTANSAVVLALLLIFIYILFLLNDNKQLLYKQDLVLTELTESSEIKDQFFKLRINAEDFVIMMTNRSKEARDEGYQKLLVAFNESGTSQLHALVSELKKYHQDIEEASLDYLNDDRLHGTLLLNLAATRAEKIMQQLEYKFHEDSRLADQLVLAVDKSNKELLYTFYLLIIGIIYLLWSRNKTLSSLLEEVTHYRDNLERLVKERTAELEDTQDELLRKQRLAAIGQLTATVSHELRNPLGSIRNALAVIYRLADVNNPMMKNAMDITERGVKRCNNIITELLDFTRYKELKKESIDIDTWLNNELDNYQHAPEIEIARELSSGLELNCDCDCERLLHAVINVLDNSCDAVMPEEDLARTSKHARITISTENVNGYAQIVVVDNGIGIPLELQGKIFEPLFSTKSFGVGLGMPLVKQIMEQHGGSVQLESEETVGTTIRLLIPLSMKEESL